MDPITVTTTHDISISQVRNLLCCALEGGSNYWYRIDNQVLPPGTVFDDFKEGGKAQDPENYWHWAQLIPTLEGGSLLISAPGEQYGPRVLNLEAIKRGLQLLADNHPAVFADVVDENEDAQTGDIFLQLCLFGEVILG
jgi:hypothetical protein